MSTASFDTEPSFLDRLFPTLQEDEELGTTNTTTRPGAIRVAGIRGTEDSSVAGSLSLVSEAPSLLTETPIVAEVVNQDDVMVRLAALEAQAATTREHALRRQVRDDNHVQESKPRDSTRRRLIFGLGSVCALVSLIAGGAVGLAVGSHDSQDAPAVDGRTTLPPSTASTDAAPSSLESALPTSSQRPIMVPNESPTQTPLQVTPTTSPTQTESVSCKNCQDCRGLMLQPVSAVVNVGQARDAWEGIRNIVDQSGLSTRYVSGVTLFDNFSAWHDNLSYHNEFIGQQGTPSVIFTVDLGSVVSINGMKLWNEDQQPASLMVLASANATDFERVGEFTPRFNAAIDIPYSNENIFFSRVFEARYVRFVMRDCQNMYCTGEVITQCTMGEIAFRQC